MTRYTNPLDVPIDLTTGHLVFPGQTTTLAEPHTPHDQAHIDTGRLTPEPAPAEPKKPKKPKTEEHPDA